MQPSKETWEGVETGHKLDLFKFLWLLLLGRCLGLSTCLSGTKNRHGSQGYAMKTI